ncbi:carbohydrate phosphatase [Lizonia empirigonia]|nr:carbohydrate phosphatase [Lizonia empirigonia]
MGFTTPSRPSKYLTVDSDGSPEVSDVSSNTTTATTPSRTPAVFSNLLAKYNLNEATLHKVQDVFIELAEAAASTKNNTSDLISDYDKKIEAMVQARLAEEFPTFEFLGEESYKHGQKLNDGPTFIVDPVDGTINFTRGFHNFAISLALAVEKKPVVALIYSPNQGKLFMVIKTYGSFMTKMVELPKYKLPLTPIPAPMPSLKKRLIAVEWDNERMGPNWELRTDVHKKLLTNDKAGGKMILSCRSMGSAALDFCYVAAGQFDGFWEGGVWVWDVAAGWLIVEEAGGIVASANPGNWHPTLEGRTYFPVRAAKREEQEAVVKELWEVMGDRKFVYEGNKAPKDGAVSAAATK